MRRLTYLAVCFAFIGILFIPAAAVAQPEVQFTQVPQKGAGIMESLVAHEEGRATARLLKRVRMQVSFMASDPGRFLR